MDNRTITVAAYEELPADLKRHYVRDGDMYVVEDDDTWAYLLLFYLVIRNGQRFDINGARLTDRQLRRRAKAFSNAFGQDLAKDYRRVIETGDARKILTWFDENREKVIAANREMFRLGAVTMPTTEIQDRHISKQMYYWDNMTEEARGGRVPNAGRVQMYGRAAYMAFATGLAVSAILSGKQMERRVLGVAEHCSDCVEYAARGWQPIGELPELGDSRCISNCRCHFIYRTADGDGTGEI
jgi:hypothetical protein